MTSAGVPGGKHVKQQRPVEFDIHVAVDNAMLQRLEGSNRLAELLAKLDVFERHVERRLCNAKQLGRRAKDQ